MPRALLASTAVLAAMFLLACGGDDGGRPAAAGGARDDSHAAAVKLIAASTAPNAKANSGVVDGEVEIALQGVPEFSEPFSSSVSGAFQLREGATLPDYELELGARNYGLTLTSVGGRSYATLGTTAYELPAAIRRRLARNAGTGGNGLTRTLRQFGVRPWHWETDERIAGTETIDGVRTTHLETSFNAGRMLRDADTLLGVLRSLGITRATGLPPTITAGARRLFVGAVTSKVGESWFGVDDKLRRKSGFTMKVRVPKADRARLGGITGGTVVGRLTTRELGEPQRISTPTDIGSFADFELALDALGDAQEARGG